VIAFRTFAGKTKALIAITGRGRDLIVLEDGY
jgi:hypothetical protein